MYARAYTLRERVGNLCALARTFALLAVCHRRVYAHRLGLEHRGRTKHASKPPPPPLQYKCRPSQPVGRHDAFCVLIFHRVRCMYVDGAVTVGGWKAVAQACVRLFAWLDSKCEHGFQSIRCTQNCNAYIIKSMRVFRFRQSFVSLSSCLMQFLFFCCCCCCRCCCWLLVIG